MNVVSLLPSATEIVYALGVEPVGVSHECDHPPAAREQPAVNFSHVDPTASAGEIDEQVLAAEADHGGVYGIHTDILDELDPDLIVTQGVCDVCAVDSVLVEEAVREIDADPAVLTTDPHSLGDVFEDIERVGAALGREDRAEELLAALRERTDRVSRRASATGDRPSVAVLDWTDPVMTAGHWVTDLVDRAGGRFEIVGPNDPSRPREWTEIRRYDPEVLVVAPCGFDLEQTARNLTDLTERPGWDELRAVRGGRAYAVDGHHLLNRPGPRLVESLEVLAGCLHPAAFDIGERSRFVAPLSELDARVEP